ILGNLRSAIDGGEPAVALRFSHSKDLKLIESFAVVHDSPLRTGDLPKDATGADPRSLNDARGAGGEFDQGLDLILVFDRLFFCFGRYFASVASVEIGYWALLEYRLGLRAN